jgi:peroxiredoxin
MSTLEQPNASIPQLTIGAMAPNFSLTSLSGATIARSAYRGRKHLGLLFVPIVDLPIREYIGDMIAAYRSVRESDGELLVVVADNAAQADGLRAAMDLPFPLLIDPDGAASRRYLPEGARYGLFILDRYAKLHAQWALTELPLPPVAEIVEWLGVIDTQCTL